MDGENPVVIGKNALRYILALKKYDRSVSHLKQAVIWGNYAFGYFVKMGWMWLFERGNDLPYKSISGREFYPE